MRIYTITVNNTPYSFVVESIFASLKEAIVIWENKTGKHADYSLEVKEGKINFPITAPIVAAEIEQGHNICKLIRNSKGGTAC